MDWLSATLGVLFLRVTVGGAVVLVMYYLTEGLYMFAGGLLIPLAAVAVWMVADAYSGGPDLPESDA